jgi:alanine racemase
MRREHSLPIWAEIDLSAIAHNCREVRRSIPRKARFAAVVKADGYGHGAVPVAETALANGADSLAVARLDEALSLRRAGLSAPILVFGLIDPSDVDILLQENLTCTVFDPQQAKTLSGQASERSARLPCHLKIDTGMGRLGLNAVPEPGSEAPFHPQALEQAEAIACLPGLKLEGVYTHFAQADSADTTYSSLQLGRFLALVEALQAKGIRFPVRHAANSGAVLDIPEAHLDLVRPGLMLYGLYPSPEVDHSSIRLRPAMTLKARIAQIKRVAPGFKISYGSTFTTTQATSIAAVAIGYADGYFRILSSRGSMLVHGTRAPIAGRVCMDQTMLDIGHVPQAAPGDEVVVFGQQDGAAIPVEELADLCSTISYEIVSAITSRVARIHLEAGSPSHED